MTDTYPHVTFAPPLAATMPDMWRRELHVRNSDEVDGTFIPLIRSVTIPVAPEN